MVAALRSPSFWWQKRHWASLLLAPLSWCYQAIADRRMRRARGARLAVPVICVGNFTAGGAGKSPTVAMLARAARSAGYRPGILMRGFGGKATAAVLVDLAIHRAAEVGDEAIMLSAVAPVAVSPARIDAAALLIAAGVDIIIMDDGLQSGRIRPDLALALADAGQGFGNGRTLPAGPLRASLPVQFEKTDYLVIVGQGDEAQNLERAAHLAGVSTLRGAVVPRDGARFSGLRVLAYAGIANPSKFHRSLMAAGAHIVETRSFGDHEPIRGEKARAILQAARRSSLQPVTTAKDMARLSGEEDPAARELATASLVLDIDMVFGEGLALRLVEEAAARAAGRF